MDIDLRSWIDYLDKHDGAFIALATISLAFVTTILAVVTGAYVWLTRELVQAQYAGVKREIVEKVFKPMVGPLAGALRGESPSSLRTTWQRLKEDEPFLVHHHLIPAKRFTQPLDAMTSEIEEAFEALRERASRVAVHVCATGYGQDRKPTVNFIDEKDLARVLIRFRVLAGPTFAYFSTVELLIPPTPPGLDVFTTDASRFSMITPEISVGEVGGGLHSVAANEIPISGFDEFVKRLRDAVHHDTDALSGLTRYRRLLERIASVHKATEREILRGSNL